MDEAILQHQFVSGLCACEAWLTVLFSIIEDAIDDLLLVNLKCFIESLIPRLLHVSKDIRLEIAIDYENGESCNILEGILECFKDMLHTFKWMFGCKDLQDV